MGRPAGVAGQWCGEAAGCDRGTRAGLDSILHGSQQGQLALRPCPTTMVWLERPWRGCQWRVGTLWQPNRYPSHAAARATKLRLSTDMPGVENGGRSWGGTHQQVELLPGQLPVGAGRHEAAQRLQQGHALAPAAGACSRRGRAKGVARQSLAHGQLRMPLLRGSGPRARQLALAHRRSSRRAGARSACTPGDDGSRSLGPLRALCKREARNAQQLPARWARSVEARLQPDNPAAACFSTTPDLPGWTLY